MKEGIAFIQLRGEPYQRTVNNGYGNEQIDCSATLDSLADNTGYTTALTQKINQDRAYLGTLIDGDGFYSLDSRLKHGEDLSFDEAFSLATFVCAGLNRPLSEELGPDIKNISPHATHLLQATALLSAMSAKESYSTLTPDEIAGLVAATISLDTVVRTSTDKSLVAFGGMGGDRGYRLNGERTKFFSLSTLASLALSAETPVHKHHSYPNTSKVAGQSAIEAFGARSDFHSAKAFERVLDTSGLVMSSCHDTRTLHTLSHSLRGETINHVIGPLSFTIDAETELHAMIGVNEKIHPETIIKSLKKLKETGFQRYGNSVAYFGTDLTSADPQLLSPDLYNSSAGAKEHVMIDEVAPIPYVTVAAFLVNGENAGTYAIYPEDFLSPEDLGELSFDQLTVKNSTEEILYYNGQALSGKDKAKTKYLAMTIGLALFTKFGLDNEDALDREAKRVNSKYLREYTQLAFDLLSSGKGYEKLEEYIAATWENSGKRK